MDRQPVTVSSLTGRHVGGLGLFAALEFSAANYHGLGVTGKSRHGAEWQVTAVAVGMYAGATHAALRLVRHGLGPL